MVSFVILYYSNVYTAAHSVYYNIRLNLSLYALFIGWNGFIHSCTNEYNTDSNEGYEHWAMRQGEGTHEANCDGKNEQQTIWITVAAVAASVLLPTKTIEFIFYLRIVLA